MGGFGISPRRPHGLSGQLVPVLCNLHSTECCLMAEGTSCALVYVHCLLSWHRASVHRAWLRPLHTSLQVLMGMDEISEYPQLQAEQPQLSAPPHSRAISGPAAPRWPTLGSLHYAQASPLPGAQNWAQHPMCGLTSTEQGEGSPPLTCSALPQDTHAAHRRSCPPGEVRWASH